MGGMREPKGIGVDMSTFLIADDSKFMRNMISKILLSAGHEVIGEASDGQQAYDEYKRIKPDIVIMDITMKDVNGLESLRMIKAYDLDAVVIMCSALGQECLVIEAIQLGAKDYIIKPFTQDRVIEAVQKAVGFR